MLAKSIKSSMKMAQNHDLLWLSEIKDILINVAFFISDLNYLTAYIFYFYIWFKYINSFSIIHFYLLLEIISFNCYNFAYINN